MLTFLREKGGRRPTLVVEWMHCAGRECGERVGDIGWKLGGEWEQRRWRVCGEWVESGIIPKYHCHYILFSMTAVLPLHSAHHP
jgi:hypothetical protein